MKTLQFKLTKLSFRLSTFVAMLSVKGGLPLLNHMLNMTKMITTRLNSSWVRLTIVLLRRLSIIYHHQGRPGLVKYCKSCCVLIQQSIAGYVIHDVSVIGPRVSRTGSGLPRILPAGARKEIRLGNPLMIKWVLTILNLFRVIEYVTFPKWSTIIAPYSGNFKWSSLTKITYSKILFFKVAQEKILSKILRSLIKIKFLKRPFKPIRVFPILKTSPNSLSSLGEWSTHPAAIVRTLLALWLFNPEVSKSLQSWCNHFNFHLNIEMTANYIKDSWFSQYFKTTELSEREKLALSTIGKLGLKDEPAGKVRVFAMVDPITQWVLFPLHKWIFHILRSIPMDGTFNQLRPLKRIPSGVPLYSFDLTSATDRLPIKLQELILAELLGSPLAELWTKILTSRSYLLDFKRSSKRVLQKLSYSVGQPMGALSSWAMLALTHHVIVQLAAHHSRLPLPFKGYAVLGDDIVIWNKSVAMHYLSIMKQMGVGVNLSKSILSPKGVGLEFAKRTIFKGIDVSPIPIKEYASALATSASFMMLVKKYNLPDSVIKTLLGLGYKSSTKCSRWKAWLFLLAIPKNITDLFTLVQKRFQKVDSNAKINVVNAFMANMGGSKVDVRVRLFRSNLISKLNNLVMDSQKLIKKLEDRKFFELTMLKESGIFIELSLHETFDKHIKELNGVINESKGVINTLRSMKGPLPTWFGLILAVKSYHESTLTLDSISLPNVVNPKPNYSSPFSEMRRWLRLWNEWQDLLK